MSHEVDKFQWLADVAKSQGGEKIEQARQKAEMWRNSPFSWVYPLVSATKGKLGRELVVALCEDAGLNARQQGGDGMKIRVEGRLVSVKFSALGMNKAYIFENICDSGYEFLFCLGVSPRAAHAWVVPIEKIEEAESQHGNADRWLTSVRPEDPPELLRDCGQTGKLDEVCATFRSYLERSSK